MDKRIYLLVCLILCVLSIVGYGTYRCRRPGFTDPCTKSVVGDHWLNKYLDGWGILHFWFFAMLCFIFPKHWKELIAAGIIWEAIEMLFKDHPFYLADCHVEVKSSNEGWWYGRWQDIVMNSLGMLSGYMLLNAGAPFFVFPLGFVFIVLGHALI